MSAPTREEVMRAILNHRTANTAQRIKRVDAELDALLDALYARLAKLEAERDAARKDSAVLTSLRRLIDDDSFAIAFQAMGQYRSALISHSNNAAAIAAACGKGEE